MQFLEMGGSLKYEKNGIAVDYNPLEYPPKRVLEKGKEEVISYLKAYDNALLDAGSGGNKKRGKKKKR